MSENLTDKDVVGVSPSAYNASNSTPNYGLPIFIESDKPSWLSDWNQAMVDIDANLKSISVNGSANTANIEALTTAIAAANTAIEGLQSSLSDTNNTVTNHESRIGGLENSVDVVQDDLIAQNALVKQMSTTLNNVKNDVETLGVNLTSISSDIDVLESRVSVREKSFQYNTGTPGQKTIIARFPFILTTKNKIIKIDMYEVNTDPDKTNRFINSLTVSGTNMVYNESVVNLTTNETKNVTISVEVSTDMVNVFLTPPLDWGIILSFVSLGDGVH